MDFMVQGSPTPRTGQRPLSGRASSARRTVSRNPITGEERLIKEQPVDDDKVYESRPLSRPGGVPSLDLNYLRDPGEHVSRIPQDMYDIALDSGRSLSTVSWGTARSNVISSRRDVKTPKGSSHGSRPDGVPGLQLVQGHGPVNQPVLKTKEPTAWDKPPVPEDVPPPSAHHQELYRQYQQEMKKSCQSQNKIGEDDIQQTIDDIKQTHPKSRQEEEDTFSKNWTKRQGATKSQLAKKLDAEEMLEYNKKQTLIETVMIDQLSRAVISDPEQNTRTPYGAYDQKRGRGSNRFMHESKVSTKATSTENLLSKRVRFGARIITRDGHDSLRELTGFFFHIDNTFTVYEFRQFGKSAKALPFMVRGRYCHLYGHRKGEPYLLTDITPGYDIWISTSAQISLPDTLKKKSIITFRVTDVDEQEKQNSLVGNIHPTERARAYEELHIVNKQEHQDRQILSTIQNEVQKKLKKRAIRTITGLGRYYRSIDSSEPGILYRFELEKGLFHYHIELSPEKLDLLFEILDPDEVGELDYYVYMHGVIGEMSEYRKSLVRKAFQKIDAGKKGSTNISEIKKFFNATFGASRSDKLEASALKVFLDAVLDSSSQTEVSYTEFEEYYEGCSFGIEDDEDFKNMLRNTWTI